VQRGGDLAAKLPLQRAIPDEFHHRYGDIPTALKVDPIGLDTAHLTIINFDVTIPRLVRAIDLKLPNATDHLFAPISHISPGDGARVPPFGATGVQEPNLPGGLDSNQSVKGPGCTGLDVLDAVRPIPPAPGSG
jgi:hypothetical protein